MLAPINIEKVKNAVNNKYLGLNILYYEEVTSTNDIALQLIKNKAIGGTLIIAEQQTKGRGRRNRIWSSPPGVGIWMSLVLHSYKNMENNFLMGMMSALAIVEAIKITAQVNATIKRPKREVSRPGEITPPR